MPTLMAGMTTYLKRYRTPVFIDHGDHGEPWGSGSFIEIDGVKFVLTNEHVAEARAKGKRLGVRFDEQDRLPYVIGDHVATPWPLDLALLPVVDAAWADLDHGSSAFQLDQITDTHASFPTEVLVFAGYAGDRSTFLFETMQFGATTSLAREVELPAGDELDPKYHFGPAYLPDLATTEIGDRGLPNPPGLSGSTVWNTRFVEAKAQGLD
jgi:hypothetical protein